MKKLIIILSLLFTLILAGVLYGKYAQQGTVGILTPDYGYMNQYPDPVPIPIPLFTLY